jgi:hypothetical protein
MSPTTKLSNRPQAIFKYNLNIENPVFVCKIISMAGKSLLVVMLNK